METNGKDKTAYDRERYLLLRDQLQAIAYVYDIAKDIMVFSYGGGEEDEAALAEVLEFVRVGVLLLSAELDPGPPSRLPAAATSRRLH